MPDLEPIPFLPLACRHRAVFFDSYGVLRTCVGTLPGVLDSLDALAEAAIPCWILTNDAS